MKYNKKSKSVVLMSVLLLVGIISSALLLGACTNKTFQSNKNTEDSIYKNDKYGFSVNLPKDFEDESLVKEEKNVIYFLNKEIQEANPENIFGVVGRIEIYTKGEFSKESLKEKEEIYGLRYLGENNNYYFGWAHATDVQISPNASEKLKEKFRSMEKEFEEIIKTFKKYDQAKQSQGN